VSNDTLRGAQARFLQARAAVGINRASRYPQITTTPQITTGTGSGNRTNATRHERVSDFLLPVDVAYEADVWGRVRLGVASAVATAQASAADLEAVRLSLHAELALDYFELRGLGRRTRDPRQLRRGLPARARADAQPVRRRDRVAGGRRAGRDAARVDRGRRRSTSARGGRLSNMRLPCSPAEPPSALQLPSSPLTSPPPEIPMGLPSDLLERRPDVAAAERRIAAAGAEVGIAQAAFFPRLFLTATAGFQSRSLLSWLNGLSTFWSAGPAVAATLADGGRRRAVSAQARAGYDETVAFYQETILRSLQEVEDSLADAARAARGGGHPGRGRRRGRAIGDARHEPVSRRRHQLPRSHCRAERRAQQSARGRLDPVTPSRRQRPADQGARRRLDGGVAATIKSRRPR
jgi:hypothetical protein